MGSIPTLLVSVSCFPGMTSLPRRGGLVKVCNLRTAPETVGRTDGYDALIRGSGIALPNSIGLSSVQRLAEKRFEVGPIRKRREVFRKPQSIPNDARIARDALPSCSGAFSESATNPLPLKTLQGRAGQVQVDRDRAVGQDRPRNRHAYPKAECAT